MNTNKLIFAIIWAIFLVFVVYLVMNLANSNQRQTPSASGNLTVWTLYDDENTFNEIVTDFKALYPQYASKSIAIESFSDYYTYEKALSNAILMDTAPDIFALLNTQQSLLENAATVISPLQLSPNDFRLSYKPVFSEDLIISDPENPNSEYVVWVPFWYETLGLLYNRRFFTRPSELETWSSVITAISDISERSGSIVPLALWNTSGVSRYSSVIISFFALEWAKSIMTAWSNQVQQVLSFYSAFSSRSGDNRYSVLSTPLSTKTDIDFFTNGDVAAMLGFPRDIAEIDKIGYQSNFLYAAPFPKYAGSDIIESVEYRYFVQHNNSANPSFAQDFLVYLASQQWQEQITETYPYYLPAHIWVEQEILEQKMYSQYNIVYKNFIHPEARQISFDAWDRVIFDQELGKILEMDSGAEQAFSSVQKYIICSSNKAFSLLNLSSPCK